MINNGINDVPEKTIVIFHRTFEGDLVSPEDVHLIVKKSHKKRDWFTPHFYRCLPLTIGNQYGFNISSQYDIAFEWDGGDSLDSIKFEVTQDPENLKNLEPNIKSHFGSGIVTVGVPFTFRTPPGVNLMTINPPNYVIPNVTVMTGVIETDNLRRNFTFNLKIQLPHIKTFIPAGLPLAAFIPVPRYFCDKFELKLQDEVFSQEIIEEEYKHLQKAKEVRENAIKNNKNKVDKDYFLGKDSFGNKFSDHQGPSD